MTSPTDLRAIRKRLGLTQDELGKILGVRRQTVAARERGLVPITRETELAMRYLAEHPDPVYLTRTQAPKETA